MPSITLPVIGLAVSIAAAVLVLALCAVAGFGAWQLRVVLPRRIKLLEDALRVYNGANATLGCRIVELETALQRVRAAPVISSPAEAPAPPPPRGLQTAAERYGTATPSVPAAVVSHPQPQLPPSQPQQAHAHAHAPHQTVGPAPRATGASSGADGQYSEAELRLAQLIKSRLSSLRVN